MAATGDRRRGRRLIWDGSCGPWDSSALSILLGRSGAGIAPLLYVRYKRNKRLAEIEEQLPEALDFLARSMRAGHAFSISLEMLGQESPDPLGQEFRVLFDEQNLGAPIEVAHGRISPIAYRCWTSACSSRPFCCSGRPAAI